MPQAGWQFQSRNLTASEIRDKNLIFGTCDSSIINFNGTLVVTKLCLLYITKQIHGVELKSCVGR